ncbi:tetratricopeptide repeat protein [Planctomycetota bacterium]
MRKDDVEKGEKLFSKTIRLKEPYGSRSYLRLGQIHLMAGRKTEAEECLARAYELNRGLGEEVNRLLMEHRAGSLAERVFRAQQMAPEERSRLLMSWGDASLVAGEHKKAADYYRRVIESDSSPVGAFVNLGNLYSMEANGLARASRVYERGLEHHPQNPVLNYNLADVYIARGLFEKAERVIRERLLPTQPGNPLYLRLLERARAPRIPAGGRSGKRVTRPGE